ncbi:MAG: putative sulfate/molybdate transporter [Myxococcota bacterium]
MRIFSILRNRIRFDRNELSGAFGDIGTDLPLILGIISATNVNIASTFTMFGIMQMITGLIYGIPMAVQPLKAMAVIVLSQKVNAEILYGGGLSVGIIMLLLTISGLLNLLAKIIPKPAIRGVQAGLGISLATVSINKYIISNNTADIALSIVAIVVIILLFRNRKYPASLIVIGMGLLYASIFNIDYQKISSGVALHLPTFHTITLDNIIDGLILLALPQIPLSLSNSVIATQKTIEDLFPERRVDIRKIGLTYSLMNLINPFFAGIPTCHGTGGLVGQYTFGARTGGSVIIYGSMYLIIGLFFSDVATELIKIFPFSVLGPILLFEGVGLILLIKDMLLKESDLFITVFVAIVSANIKNGYLIGLVAGTIIWYLFYIREKNKK